MKRTTLLAAVTTAFFVSAATVAFAATVEYDFTVPVTINAGTSQHSLAQLSVTVACAVGGTSLGYSTASGDAATSTGEGRTRLPNASASVATLTGSAKVVVTDTSGTASQYLCFAKLSDGSTPVNFIHGTITKNGTGASITNDAWDTVSNQLSSPAP
jgi:hypothetical protein